MADWTWSSTSRQSRRIARVCTGELLLDVRQRVALADLPARHAQAGAGGLLGKVVVLAPSA